MPPCMREVQLQCYLEAVCAAKGFRHPSLRPPLSRLRRTLLGPLLAAFCCLSTVLPKS